MRVDLRRVLHRKWAACGVLLAASLCGPAVGQDRVILKGGKTIVGKVIGEEEGSLIVEVEFGQIRIRRANVAEIRPVEDGRAKSQDWVAEPLPPPKEEPESRPAEKLEPVPPPESAPPQGPPLQSVPPEELPAGGAEPEPPVAGAGGDTPPEKPAPGRAPKSRLGSPNGSTQEGEATLDERFTGAIDRYLWFLPKQGGFLVAIGAGLLIVSTLLTMLACRMADIEDRSFGRALLFSASVLSLFGAALEIQTRFPSFLLPIVCAGLLVWFALTRGILKANLFRGGVLLVFFFFCTLLGVFWVEVLQIALKGD
jgi:hypothetical protein